MKPNRYFVPLGLALFLLLCLVPSGQAQTGCTPISGSSQPWQLGLTCTFNSSSTATGAFSVKGLTFWQVLFVPTGTVSAATLSLDSSATGTSWTTGGIIAAATIGSAAAAGSYSNTTATTPTLYGQLTPSITGSGSVTVMLFGYVSQPSSSGGGGGGNVTVSNFPNPQNVAQSGTWTVQPGNTANSTPWLTTDAADGSTGSAVPSKALLVAGKNGSGNQQAIATDSSGNVGVNIQNVTATSGATNITASQCAVVAVGGASEIGVVVSGTWTGTLQPKVSIDGTNYTNALVYATFPAASSAATITANGQWNIVPQGATSAEVCGNTVATGTAVVTVNATPGVGQVTADVELIGGKAVTLAAAGIQKVGVSGGGGASIDATVAAGAAPTNALATLSQYNTTMPAPTAAQTVAIQADQAGNTLEFPGVQFKAGTAWNNATTINTLQYPTGTATQGQLAGAPAVLVQLDQTTTVTGGAVTFQGTYDNVNWVTIPVAQVLNPNTLAQLTNPYTFVASTNQPFLLLAQGYVNVRANLTTLMTGTGSITPQWATLPGAPTFNVPATAMVGTVPGAAPVYTDVAGGIYNSAAPAPTTGQTLPLQLDASGNLSVSFRTTSNGCMGNNSSYASININASTTSAVQLIALAAGKKIYVCSFIVIGGGTSPTFSLVYGTGTNCGTGTTTLMGAIPLSTTAPVASPFSVGVTAVANALCTQLAGTSPTAVGVLSYVQ
jgi:hypothetical protein